MKAACEFRRLKPGYETLGLVLDFVSRGPPYDGFATGVLVQAIKTQITQGQHIAAIRDGALVGYMGWVPITFENGAGWIEGRATLVPLAEADADASAVTIVRTEGAGIARALVRHFRDATSGRRAFFRKDYPGKPTRHRSVGIFRGG